MHSRPLQGKVALVTGAGRGIGRSIALRLAANGTNVSLAARTESQLRAVQEEIEAHGAEAASFPTDVSSEPDVIRLMCHTIDRFGRLDILVNDAGIGVFRLLAETTTEEWDRVMAVNVRGPFLLCREALPYLKQRERSFVINISSVVGLKGYASQAAYSASKHAVMGMTKAFAREVQNDGVRVHAICPGGVDTQLAVQARPDLDRSVLIQPDEIADIVLFLVTRQGNAVVDQIDVRRAVSMPWA